MWLLSVIITNISEWQWQRRIWFTVETKRQQYYYFFSAYFRSLEWFAVCFYWKTYISLSLSLSFHTILSFCLAWIFSLMKWNEFFPFYVHFFCFCFIISTRFEYRSNHICPWKSNLRYCMCAWTLKRHDHHFAQSKRLQSQWIQ